MSGQEPETQSDWRSQLDQGQVIPACPLALTADGRWSRRHQRALVRYYLAAGAGGLAVGVHSTQFAIRDPAHGLFEPVLRLVSEEIDRFERSTKAPPVIRIAGVCGRTEQAISEGRTAAKLGYHAALLSLTAVGPDGESAMLDHLRRVAKEIPVIGFYLQPAVGGRVLSHDFWCRFAEVPEVVAIKIAPFNRYQTLDVVRAVLRVGREDLALYTGNDDNIIGDLMTTFEMEGGSRRIVGGLLGQWGVWTRAAVEMLGEIRRDLATDRDGVGVVGHDWWLRNAQLTDANGAVFDAANGFGGCIPGILEVLRRQGLLPSNRCLDPDEVLSPGQAEELDRVTAAYPWLVDDAFVAAHLAEWLDADDRDHLPQGESSD
ncbi:MAG: dihydrodipicolinate synthase family protein [Planctomycetaceae bacterium]|nr:MAG: dihydrodipicolinate synthase family protein [Planctomycetaceae bacterium]